MVQQSPMPTEKQLRRFYAKTYRKEYKKVLRPKAKHIFRAGKLALERLEFLKQAGVKLGSLMDIGAGGGEFVTLASREGFKAQGIDPSEGYAKYAQKEYGANLSIGELKDLKGTYDVITLFHVLEHLTDPIKVFEKLRQHLKAEGTLFIEVPNIETSDASPDNIFFKAHTLYFSEATLKACASPFFDVTVSSAKSNLRMVFKRKKRKAKLVLPTEDEVKRAQMRQKRKGWVEYLTKGRGYQKLFKRLGALMTESKVSKQSGKEILEHLSS